MKKILKVVFLVLCISILIPYSTLAAPRMVCSGSTCNGIDPQGSGCSAITANFRQATGSSGSGNVQGDLRYSSNCNSKWSRATNYFPGAVRKLHARLTDDSSAYLNVEVYSSSLYGQIWTDMHNGSDPLCSIVSQGFVGGSYDATTNPACY